MSGVRTTVFGCIARVEPRQTGHTHTHTRERERERDGERDGERLTPSFTSVLRINACAGRSSAEFPLLLFLKVPRLGNGSTDVPALL